MSQSQDRFQVADARFAMANSQNDPDADGLSNDLEKLADFFFF